MFVPGFSKGSAYHISWANALENAIMEAIEADALMINWYCARETNEIVIDDIGLNKTLSHIMKNVDFSIQSLDHSLKDSIGYCFAAVVKNNKNERPKYVMGCAAGLNPVIGPDGPGKQGNGKDNRHHLHFQTR